MSGFTPRVVDILKKQGLSDDEIKQRENLYQRDKSNNDNLKSLLESGAINEQTAQNLSESYKTQKAIRKNLSNNPQALAKYDALLDYQANELKGALSSNQSQAILNSAINRHKAQTARFLGDNENADKIANAALKQEQIAGQNQSAFSRWARDIEGSEKIFDNGLLKLGKEFGLVNMSDEAYNELDKKGKELLEQRELDRNTYKLNNPNSWNIAGNIGDFTNSYAMAGYAMPFATASKAGKLARTGILAAEGAGLGIISEAPKAAVETNDWGQRAEKIGTAAGIGAVATPAMTFGLEKLFSAGANKIANRGTNGVSGAETAPNAGANGGNGGAGGAGGGATPPPNAPKIQAGESLIKGLDDDLATNGSWIDGGNTPPPSAGAGVEAQQKIGDVPLNITAIENLKARQGELNDEIKSATELLKKARTKKTRNRLKEQIKSANDELKAVNIELQKPITAEQSAGLRGFDDDGLVRGDGFATDPNSAKTMNTDEIAANEAEILGSGKAWNTQKGELVPLNANDDIIDLVPDENGVWQVVYNGDSKKLAKIATEIAKGEPQSMGAKRLVFIADNIAETAAKNQEQAISANIAKIDDDAIELYARNTALLDELAKKYPTLSKDEVIELANKQIMANASPELLEYSRFLNGGKLPSDARLLGKNAGRMILKSLKLGAKPEEIINMLLKAGISGRNSTAAKALIQTGNIDAYNAVMRQGEQELLAELSSKVRSAAKNESLGAILDRAKARAIENDKLLKNGMGNQSLDDVATTFKSAKSGKEFEVAENGFGRELMSYDGKVANEEMKRAFSSWEAQGGKTDITLNDGRKVVYLEPDEAVQLSYGNSYLYGEKDLEALFARRKAESLEQRVERLQSHPAYENLLKMRENTKASELKGETVGGSKPTVYYEPQSERYLRTKGGGGLPNGERGISITKADVAKLRAGKVDDELATKLENSLEALTGDPAASGLIDDLLTRDYHLASAAKKSELVAPKGAGIPKDNAGIPKDNAGIPKDNAGIPKDNVRSGGFKKGFSTQAINEVMLGLGSGTANAMAEDDPNKKTEAFIKGFLAGFGGAKAAGMLAKNAPKLAPQLARASQKMAQEFPNLMANRPDILGGVLGRMNNAKDKFNFIFGGEKALGANKAKLKEAKTMLASDEEIWAKTGWYEDIDGNWKFEINPKGGELKKEFVDENVGDFFEKEIKTQKDLKAMEKYGEVDYEKFKENAKYYRKDYTQKVKDLLLNGSLKSDKLYREYMDKPLGEVKSKYKFRSGFLADILDDKSLFKAYPMLKDIRVRALDGDNGASGGYRYGRGSDILGDIFINFNLNPTAFKSTLYHEIQHAVQHIENFSNGSSPKQWGFEKYQRLAGEAEARNVQARLGTNGKEYPLKTMDIDPNERIVTDEYGYESASVELEKAFLDKNGKINYEALRASAVPLPKVKSLGEFRKDFLNAGKKINAQNVELATPAGKISVNPVLLYNHLGNNSAKTQRFSISGGVLDTFQKPLFVVRDDRGSLRFYKPFVSPKDEVDLVSVAIDKNGKYQGWTSYNSGEDTLFELIKGKNEDLIYFKGRQASHPADEMTTAQSSTESSSSIQALKMSENSSVNEIKSQELAIRESFSPELKASYDMRDKLLKSTSEVRASLSDKGKAELEKLANSNDSKLSRDAQIMKTLENAKSDPARYEKLKKLYLDENGNVKDSIGLC